MVGHRFCRRERYPEITWAEPSVALRTNPGPSLPLPRPRLPFEHLTLFPDLRLELPE
jgi:hypothetical protein